MLIEAEALLLKEIFEGILTERKYSETFHFSYSTNCPKRSEVDIPKGKYDHLKKSLLKRSMVIVLLRFPSQFNSPLPEVKSIFE